MYEALNPHGIMPDIHLTPLAPRLNDLDGKAIYVIHSWPVGSGSQMDELLSNIGFILNKRFPKIKCYIIKKPHPMGPMILNFGMR